MSLYPLIIDSSVKADIAYLRQKAFDNVVTFAEMERRAEVWDTQGMMDWDADAYTILIPTCYVVTFSVDELARHRRFLHMSLSINKAGRPGRAPSPEAVELVAHEFGFTGTIKDWNIHLEPLQEGDYAVAIAQPVNQ